MKSITFRGCGTALVTPFTSDGSVDYEAYARLIDRQVAAGVDFLVPLATTGETPALTQEEKEELLKITVAHAAGKPIVPGVGVNCVRDTINNIRLMEPYKPDAFLVVVPYYNKPTQKGQYEYFKTIAASTDVPIVIYNVPGRTGANMLPDTCIRLAEEIPGIVAIKEASGNYSQVSEMIRRSPEGFSVLSGDDDMTLAFIATGAQGVISVASNIAPKEVTEMVSAALDNDIVKARALHHRLFPLFKACFVESNPIPAKSALARMGLCLDAMRLPLAPASEATAELMAKVMKDAEIL